MSTFSTYHFCHTQLANFKSFLSLIVSAQTQINDLKHYLESRANQNELAYLFAYIQGVNQVSIFPDEPICTGSSIEDNECLNVKGAIDLRDILEKSLFQGHSALVRSLPQVKNILCDYFELEHPDSSIGFGKFISLLKPRYPKASTQKHSFENSIISFTQIVDAIVNSFFTIQAKRQELSSIQIKQLFMHKYGDQNAFKIESLKSFMHDVGIYNKDAFSKAAHYLFGDQKIIPWESILPSEPEQKQEKGHLNGNATALCVQPSSLFEKVDQLENKLKNAIKRRQSYGSNQNQKMESKISDKITQFIDQKLRKVGSRQIIKYGIPNNNIQDKKVEVSRDKENRQEMCPWSTTQKIAEIQRRAVEMQERGKANKNNDFNEFWKLRFREHYFPQPSKTYLRTHFRTSY